MVLWSDRRLGLAIAISLAVAAGLLSAWLTPRGPITTGEALVSMAAALAVGLAAGEVLGSRWSVLITPIVFIAVLEVARLGVDGPTVDGIHPGSLYGLMALALGRGVHGLLVIAPMVLGSLLGVELATRLGKGADGEDGTGRLALQFGAYRWATCARGHRGPSRNDGSHHRI